MSRAELLHRAMRALPDSALTLLASVVAPKNEVAFEPGWTFASAGERTSRNARARRALWREAARRRLSRPVTVDWVDGLRLRMYLGTDLSWCVYVGGAYEPNELAFLCQVTRPGMTFVDGGAHEGLYSLLAWRRTRPGGRVIAFEPSTEASTRLHANLALNGAESVTLHKMALGDRPGHTDLALAAYGHDGQNTVGLHIANPLVDVRATETVAVTTLDTVVESDGIERVDVIKLDVEGSELRVLHGARATLQELHPVLLLEAQETHLRQQGGSVDKLMAFLDDLGYEIWVYDLYTGAARPRRAHEDLSPNIVATPRGWSLPR